MHKSLILNKLRDNLGFSTDTEFALFLGISSQTLSNWKTRNTFDIDLIYSKCEKIDANWLLTGKGEMFKKSGDISIGGDNKGVANTGSMGDVTYNSPDATKDINDLLKSYSDVKGVEIDRLQTLYDIMLKDREGIISEKNALIEELKGIIQDLRDDKKKLTELLTK